MTMLTVQSRGQITLTQNLREVAGIHPGDRLIAVVTGPGQIALEVFRPLSVAEMVERYRIDEPVDWEADSEQWHDDAVREVVNE